MPAHLRSAMKLVLPRVWVLFRVLVVLEEPSPVVRLHQGRDATRKGAVLLLQIVKWVL